MTFPPLDRDRRVASEPFVRRDWIALLVICLLAVVIRACIMTLLPSILHPDERDWLEAADRLVNHQGLLTWDFQVGERSWLWPGLIAGFMAIGQLFGSPARRQPRRRRRTVGHYIARAGDLRLPRGAATSRASPAK